MAFLKAKRREKDLVRDVSSEAIQICSKLIYFFKIITTASKPHNIGSITTSSANAIFCVDDVITARFIKN